MTLRRIGGGIGIGLGLPGLNISIGGGIGIGGRKGGCGSHDPSKKWSQCPNDHTIIDLARFAVAEFNRKYGNNLEFQVVSEAWVFIHPDRKKEYTIELVAKDGCLNRTLKLHAVVTQTSCGARTLVSFDQMAE